MKMKNIIFTIILLLLLPLKMSAVEMKDGRHVTEKQMLEYAKDCYLKASDDNHLADSAIYYYTLLTQSRNVKHRAMSHLGLTKVYLYLRQSDKASQELYRYETARDTAEYISIQQNNARIRRSMTTSQQLYSGVNFVFIVLLVVFMLLVAIGVISWLLIRNKNQKAELLKIRLERIQDLHQQYLAKDQAIKDQEIHSIEDSSIYQKLQQMLTSSDGAQYLTDEMWDEITSTINKIYPDFEHRLFSLSMLSQHEYHVCALLKMGFAPSVIAQLTARSKEAITSTRRRLYEKAFGQKGTPKDWDDVILSL